MSAEPLISVVIPAFDAAATLDETLRSVRGQSWNALEVVIVDDGSRDATAEIAERHVAADPRVKLIRTANAGVAAARNLGWQSAQSELIAFIDADDVWARDKLRRQMAALEAAGSETGLVYSRYAQIDAASRVIYLDTAPVHEGEVFEKLMHGNFVGNGSAALVRRTALEQARGFEPALRAAGAQGCEDILFYLRVAQHWRFGVVPQPDIGYRLLPQAMSADLARMFRSWLLVRKEILASHPGHRPALDAGARAFGQWLVEQALRRRQFGQLPGLLAAIVGWRGRAAPSLLACALNDLVVRRPDRRSGADKIGALFEIGEPV